ncbi:hypothetical protein HG530_015183 [Fusarium avenaceum]|nr:hypothetical protein HG530_015183 [Fusarium avenaceum]
MLSSLVLRSQLLVKPLSSSSKVGLVIGSVLASVDKRNEPGGVGEEIVHLLKRQLLGLRDEGPDTEGVGKVSNDEEEVVLPADCLHSNTSNLTDHGVECERGHGSKRDTLGASAGDDDKAPTLSRVTRSRGIHGQHNGGDNKGKHVEEVTPDKSPSAAESVNEGNAKSLGDKSNDGVDGLILEGILSVDSSLSVDLDRIVLDGRYTSHLDRGLKTAGNQKTAEARRVLEKLEVGLCLVGMLVCDAFLNLLHLGANPRIVNVAVGVEASQGEEGLFLLALVHEPAGRLGENEDQGTEKDGRDDLDTERNAPLSVISVMGECAPASPRGNEGSNTQHELLEGGDSACTRAGHLESTSKHENDRTNGDGPSSTGVLGGRASESGSEEGAGCEEGNYSTTATIRSILERGDNLGNNTQIITEEERPKGRKHSDEELINLGLHDD